ncbi:MULTISPECIES: polysaccharide deacetylase family protein [unclassified Paenibacillus]|uniref:polysaccharide deacetylase family protein n=1 Tax=unclassified Paenibacillus TaxID=185978 RepID=UPI001B3CD584|nr:MULTISPECIES: polysaccharide deacetylase family protein [unclassified Paenibacillus]MBP1157012.1 peptidoglycan/xylan/chitin deacetylase (PgdA/CDA1 family) [Paenibacillus sp. PvP091]MBP1172249.1 peptidoglycan/xylan/chitin deacetylase (PgdA/CDA1 family) [Paenibacillus sp. PvR098]MBP2438630.1 peptidoglycan/xylan/chitin deacetylase (PgdA/CDA1 family) [Paenibacillus sp. PvP052]
MCYPFYRVPWMTWRGSIIYDPFGCMMPYAAWSPYLYGFDPWNGYPTAPITNGGLREPVPLEPHIGGPERPEEHASHIEHLDWSSKYPTEVILHGPLLKEAALTFDDGPDDQWTPKVLDVLARFHVKATFFVVGSRCDRNPDMLRRIAREGHVIGNHSWNHPNMAKLSPEVIRSQIQRTDDVIRMVTGTTPFLLRPPYGALSDTIVEEAIKAKKKIILWNVDSLDWMQLNGKQVAANILAHTCPGSIILQHSAGGVGESLQGTVDALPGVIKALRTQSYKLLTVPELLKNDL